MEITAAMVKKLRDMTGAGIMECKTALSEAEGDIEKAVEILRKRGTAIAKKKAGRTTPEGVVVSYVHFNNKIGVLLELGCETDFVARTDDFRALAYEIAKHVAAMSPQYITREDVPEEVISKEREIYLEQMKDSNKPEHIVEKIVEGKLEKFYQNTCLYEQKYIFDEAKTVKDLIEDFVSKVRENVRVTRFVRMEVGIE